MPLMLTAQIRPLADQYIMNFFQMNPAIAGVGSYEPLIINSKLAGNKWDNGKLPGSYSATYQSKLFKEKSYFTKSGFLNRGKNAFGKVGIGIGLYKYSYGNVAQTGFHLDYSYHIFLAGGRLCFGLSPVFILFEANRADNSLYFPDINPDKFIMSVTLTPINVSIIDFNAGVHFYSETISAGFSCLQMTNSWIKIGDYSPLSSEKTMLNPNLARSMYGYFGYRFNINRSFQIEPLLMIKYYGNQYDRNSSNKLKFDINASAYLFKDFHIGISYKYKETSAIFCGVRLSNFQVRYLYEMPLSGKSPILFTSHMIQVGFNLGQKIQ